MAKLAELGIARSYSRPGVSDDTAYAERLFHTCTYRPEYPGAFTRLEAARQSPGECGKDATIFTRRIGVYEAARARNPERWSRGIA